MTIRSPLQAGQTDFEQAEFAHALTQFQEAHTAAPLAVEPVFWLALTLLRLNDNAQALQCIQWLLQRGEASLGHDPHTALACFISVEQLGAHGEHLFFNQALAYTQLERPADAVAALDRALTCNPEFAEAHNNRAVALRALGRHGEALLSIDRALRIKPDYIDAKYNRGGLLIYFNRHQAALECYDQVLQQEPNHLGALVNRSVAYTAMGRYHDALASLTQSKRLAPDIPQAHVSEAFNHLALGQFEQGWAEYEWRKKLPTHQAYALAPRTPEWDGCASLLGKRIILYAEQGLGDTLQFVRYATLLAERGALVTLAVQSELVELLARVDGVVRTVDMQLGGHQPEVDYQCALMSLPHLLKTDLDCIPARLPYLHADPNQTKSWAQRFDPTRNPLRVGLVWAGGLREHDAAAHATDRMRSMSFDQMVPLLEVQAVDFYCLQKGKQAHAQLEHSPARHRVIDWTDALDNFNSTAALIQNLDLVITVDTSVAHLTGALGKPVWMLNRAHGCWRWLVERTDSPWYPKVMRIFRQPRPMLWAPTIEEVRTALVELTQQSKPSK